MEIKTLILKEIACGKPLNGNEEKPDWPCGDFLEQEQNKNGRWIGQYYFCKECHEKAKKILEYFNELLNSFWRDGSEDIAEVRENHTLINLIKQSYKGGKNGK